MSFVTADGRTLLWTPADDVLTPLLAWMDAATISLHLHAYAFTLKAVAQKMIDKHNAGLDVRGIFDASQSGAVANNAIDPYWRNELALGGITQVAALQMLKAGGVPYEVGVSSKGSLLHDKYCVRDATAVFYGSWNFSLDSSNQDNHVVWEPNVPVATQFDVRFLAEWFRLSGASQP